ncbi:MAG: hypothetical protein AAFY88_14995 [Acidobacteriota bacterium]
MKALLDAMKGRALMVLYVGCGLSLLGELVFRFVGHSYDHMHFGYEEIFGVHAGWGFIAFALLVASAHALGALTRRDEDFYDEDRGADDA